MVPALVLLAVQGAFGGFDTLYYHEWRAHLPAGNDGARSELRLHALRDFIYAALFCSLPFFAWHGLWAWVLATLIVAEIIITLADFVVEDRVARRALGGLYSGERITHALMGIVFGAMLAYLVPATSGWWMSPTRLVSHAEAIPLALQVVLLTLGVGVALSGLRDTAAALQVPHSNWPWPRWAATPAQSREDFR